MKDSTVRTAGLLRAQKPAILKKIRAAMRQELEKYTKGDFVTLPMPALVAAGLTPSKEFHQDNEKKPTAPARLLSRSMVRRQWTRIRELHHVPRLFFRQLITPVVR